MELSQEQVIPLDHDDSSNKLNDRYRKHTIWILVTLCVTFLISSSTIFIFFAPRLF